VICLPQMKANSKRRFGWTIEDQKRNEQGEE